MKWEIGDMEPWHELYFLKAIQVLRAVPSKPLSRLITKEGSKFDDVRSLSKRQLLNYIVECKHSGYEERFQQYRFRYYKDRDTDVLIASKVLYARHLLIHRHDLITRAD